MVGELGTLDY